jgi:membrane protein insertase Oxa1/YidC/SpoIIIJ
MVLFDLFVEPLLLIYDGVFSNIYLVVGSVGWTLVWFGIVLNLALLPLYYQMERAGRAGAARREQMNKEVARMRAHYRGRERYFYIRTIHRHYGYQPIHVVFESIDLYLQVLVFATVYRYLAFHPALANTSFMEIADLSQPDGLLFGVNLLPILMTLLNVVSARVHTRDDKQRWRAFGLAGLFLVLLYRSPSGLVLYWTSNNAFSLLRNLVDRRLGPALPAGASRWWSQLAHQE